MLQTDKSYQHVLGKKNEAQRTYIVLVYVEIGQRKLNYMV